MSAWKTVVGLVAMAAIAGVGYVRWAARPIPLPQLIAMYKLPNSQFADIDGVQVHYVEQGTKYLPCVVMLESTTTNLHIWDDVADAMKDHFHVIRLDTLTLGLTGPDPHGDYSMGHNPHIIEVLTDRLGSPRCSFVGNGGGGRIAYRYATAHPERVDRLILIGSAGGPHTPASRPVPPSAMETWFAPRSAFAYITRRDFGDVPPTEDFIQQNYDMNRRAGLVDEIHLAKLSAAGDDAQSYLPKLHAPTLLIWGTTDDLTPIADVAIFEKALTHAPTMTKLYKNAGHYPFVEHPKEVVADMAAFLSGAHDGELRQPVQDETPPADGAAH